MNSEVGSTCGAAAAWARRRRCMWPGRSGVVGGDKGFLRSWRATGNGIESISPLHNDGFLCLDDLGQVLAQDAGRVAYQLANGQTTQRANRRGGARASEDFLLISLSNGEISLAQHVRQGGQQVRGGQEIRMCDIPA